jgi:hypothetical protein
VVSAAPVACRALLRDAKKDFGPDKGTSVVVRSHRSNLPGWDYFGPCGVAKPDNGLETGLGDSSFGLVIGLLSWIYLSAHITLLAAEGNVVATRKLWPRSFSLMIEQPATQADKRALTQRGKVEERRQDETVSVDFPASAKPGTSATGGGSDDADQQPSA